MPLTLPAVNFDPTKTIIPRKAFIVWTPDAGIAQVETAICAGTVSGAGNATVTVTGSGITGSPVAVSVAVLNGDTPFVWAAKARAALRANANIAAVYNVGGAGTELVLRRIIPAANDATLNIAIATGTATGITAAASSRDTIPGVVATAVNLIGKVARFSNDVQEVEREVPDLDGLLRPDRIVAIQIDQSFGFELEDVGLVKNIFGGLHGGLAKGTIRLLVTDPDDAAGAVAVASNTVAATCELDGGVTFNAGEVAKCTLKFTPLAALTLTADATT